jgi:glycosyltransferase involved in cell wall biosynthesis
MNRPSLIFVIPAYGKSPFIEECLQSLVRQSHACEIRIATSTPSTWLDDLALHYGVQVFINPKADGIASDWNFALSCGGTDLVALAHQDDIYLENYAELITNFFARTPDAAMAFTDLGEVINDKKINMNLRIFIKKILLFWGFLFSNTIASSASYRRLLSLGCPIPCPAVTFNRHEVGDFQFSKDYQVNLDWKAWTDLSKKNLKMGYLRGVQVLHRIHAGAETQKAVASRQREREDIALFSQYWPKSVVLIIIYFYRLGYR